MRFRFDAFDQAEPNRHAVLHLPFDNRRSVKVRETG
jgi:hypothetical protein